MAVMQLRWPGSAMLLGITALVERSPFRTEPPTDASANQC